MNSLALLPNLAGPDMIIIFLIVLIMFGAKKLPELAKGLGQAVREFSKAKDDMNSELHRTVSVETPSYHPPVDPALHAHQPAPATPATPAAVHAPVDVHAVPSPVAGPVAGHEATHPGTAHPAPSPAAAAPGAAPTATPHA